MRDQDSKTFSIVSQAFGASMLNFGLAFALGWLMSRGWVLFGGAPTTARTLGLAGLMLVLFADPVTAWKEAGSWRAFWIKLGLGCGLATFGSLWILAGPASETPSEGTPAMVSEDVKEGLPWHFFGVFLIVPIVFAMPLLEKILGAERSDQRPDREEIAISAAFPIFMTVILALQLGITGALFLLDASAATAGVLFVVAIVLVVLDVAFGNPDEAARDLQEKWGPRPETASESWANLRQGMGQSVASGLFIATTIYLSLIPALPMFGDMIIDETTALDILWPILKGSCVMLIVFSGLTLIGTVIAGAAAYCVGKTRGLDILSLVDLGNRSVARLFMGGMSWVQPDQENEC